MLGVASLLCGCAAMSESECLSADWYAVGERDGRDGRPAAQLDRYYDACAKFGVHPNNSAYLDGRDRGLTFYCTADTGYEEGRFGGNYRGVCPPISESSFLQGYDMGRSVRQAAESVQRIEFEIEAAREEIRSLEREIDRVESPDHADASSKGDEAATDRLHDMHRQIGHLEADIEALQDDRVYAIVEYRRAADHARSMGFHEDYEY